MSLMGGGYDMLKSSRPWMGVNPNYCHDAYDPAGFGGARQMPMNPLYSYPNITAATGFNVSMPHVPRLASSNDLVKTATSQLLRSMKRDANGNFIKQTE